MCSIQQVIAATYWPGWRSDQNPSESPLSQRPHFVFPECAVPRATSFRGATSLTIFFVEPIAISGSMDLQID
jgi:hypothetical protein